MDSSKLTTGFGCFFIAGIGVFQFIAGIGGIHYLGGWVALTAAVIISAIFRAELPWMVGTYVCCAYVWRWPWPLALIATLPGLLFLIPDVVASMFALLSEWRSNRTHARSETQPLPVKGEITQPSPATETISSISESPKLHVENQCLAESGSEVSVPENTVTTVKKNKTPPSGVGGLLSFFAFIAILQPLWTFSFLRELDEFRNILPSLHSDVLYPLKSFLTASILCTLGIALFSHITGLIIIGGVKWTKKLVYCYFVTCIILVFIPYIYVIDLPFQMKAFVRQGMDPGVFRTCIWIGAWWLYFTLSKRVSNTYDSGLPVDSKSSILWAVYKSVCLVMAVFATVMVTSSLIAVHRDTGIYSHAKVETSSSISHDTHDLDRIYGTPSSQLPEENKRSPSMQINENIRVANIEKDFASRFDFSTWDRTAIHQPSPAMPPQNAKEMPKDEGRDEMTATSESSSLNTTPIEKPGHVLLAIGDTDIWIPEPRGFDKAIDAPSNSGVADIGATFRLGYSKFHEQSKVFSTFTLLTFDGFDDITMTESDFSVLIKAMEETEPAIWYYRAADAYATFENSKTDEGMNSAHATVYCLVKGKLLGLGYTAGGDALPDTTEAVVKKFSLSWRDAIIAANK